MSQDIERLVLGGESIEIMHDGQRLCQLGAYREIHSLVFDDIQAWERFRGLDNGQEVTATQEDVRLEFSLGSLKAKYGREESLLSIHIGPGAKEILNKSVEDAQLLREIRNVPPRYYIG